MYAALFLITFIFFVFLSAFVFMNYPAAWRKNRLSAAILVLWHAVGILSLFLVLTIYKDIPQENIRYEITRIATFYYIPTMLMAIFFFVRILYSRTCQYIYRKNGIKAAEQRRKWFSDKQVQTVFMIVLSFGICIYGYFNVDYLHLRQYDVTVSAPSGEEELKICLIADIHAGSGTWEYTYDDLAEQIDACEADVLFIAGDLFDETTSRRDVDYCVRALRSIRQPRYGMYYIYGNHDGLMEDWVPGAKEAILGLGVHILSDEMVLLGEDIQLIGCLDPKLGAKSLANLFQSLKPDPDKPIILMTHRPKHFAEMAELGVDLALSGHTHGFNIPQAFAISLSNDMYSGLRQYGNMTAITTSGVGTWGFHYKMPAESEVVSIRVRFGGNGK